MQNKFGVAAEGADVIIMRLTMGQRLNREDLGNLLAHLIVLGDVTNEELTAVVNELEDESAPPSRAAPPPPPPKLVPPPSPPPTVPGSRRAREAASLQAGAAGNGKDDE